MMKNKKWLALLLSAAMLVPVAFAACADGNDGGDEKPPVGDTGNNGDTGNETADTSTKLTGKIYLVGDSTVCGFDDNYYLPRYGYGTQLYNYINCDANQIVNLALSGRSSKSYTYDVATDSSNRYGDKNSTISYYEHLTASISAGDYLIIGFGHNDQKSAEPARFTSPVGDKSVAGSFQNSLYENYVKLATEKGATPILCTPIVRYDTSGNYTGNKVHVTSDGDYAAAIRALGEDTGTTVVDLTELTKTVYKADNAAAAYFHAHTSYNGEKPNETPTGRDDTHINMYGAKMVSYKLTQALLNTNCSLKANIKTNSKAPTKDMDYVSAIKTSYERPNYTPFDPSNYNDRNVTGDWYRTVIGNIGGKKATNFTITHNNGVFVVGNSGNANGKFDVNGDGFGAIFMQIDKNKNFTASASVKVNEIGADKPNQSGFGLMLRDDIHIDGVPVETYTGKEIITSNYVTAGAFGDGSSTLFSRENGTLTKTNKATTVAVGSTYTVSIERVGQTVKVAFSDGTNNYTNTYTDFDFVAVDNNYMYLCLFANRGIVAEFTNVQFEITGDSQGA